MKKSSLGRRSSMLSQYGSQSTTDNTRQKSMGGKKSSLLQPGFAVNRNNRASSADRLNASTTFKKENPVGGLKRSKSQLNFDTNLPWQTPRCRTGRSLSASGGSIRSNRPSSTDGRASSAGGITGRKEIRPIGEKAFQSAAQENVQNFFMNHAGGSSLLINGSMKQITTGMFVSMVDYVVKYLDPLISITKVNYTDEIMRITKLYKYKGKVDRSWLISVNTIHSWGHVVALLSWLVDLVHQKEVLDIYKTMYPVEEMDDDYHSENDTNFRILTPHLLRGYNLEMSGENDDEEMEEFLREYRREFGVNNEEMLKLESSVVELRKELCSWEKVDAKDQKEIQGLNYCLQTLTNDIKQQEDYIADSKEYTIKAAKRHSELMQDIKNMELEVESAKNEMQSLKTIVETQEMSIADKKAIELQMANIKNDIDLMEKSSKELKDILYKEELAIASLTRQVKELGCEYNKTIAVHATELPEITNASIETNVRHPDFQQCADASDEILSSVTENLRCKIEKEENVLHKLKNSNSELESETEKLQIEVSSLQAEILTEEREVEDLKCELDEETNNCENNLAELRDANKWDEIEIETLELELKEINNELTRRKERNQKYDTMLPELSEFIVNAVEKKIENLNKATSMYRVELGRAKQLISQMQQYLLGLQNDWQLIAAKLETEKEKENKRE